VTRQIVNWTAVILAITKSTGRTKKSIGHESGIGENALSALTNSLTYAEPLYSEGEVLLKLYAEATDDPVPVVKRSPETTCPSCYALTTRDNILRITHSSKSCVNCIERTAKRVQLRHKTRVA